MILPRCECWNFQFQLEKTLCLFLLLPRTYSKKDQSHLSWYLQTSTILKIFCIHQYYTRHSGVFGFLSLHLSWSENFSRLWLKTYSNSKHLISSVLSPGSLSSTQTFHFFLPTFYPFLCGCLIFIFLFFVFLFFHTSLLQF